MKILFRRQQPTPSSLYTWGAELDEPCVCAEGECVALNHWRGIGDEHDEECARCDAEITYDGDHCPTNPEIHFHYIRQVTRREREETAKKTIERRRARRTEMWAVIAAVTGVLALVCTVVLGVG